MAKPKKDVGGTKWLGRKNKSRQDAMPMGLRQRVHDAQDRLAFMREHKPVTSSDWNAFRKNQTG
jgi:hypothetical protein